MAYLQKNTLFFMLLVVLGIGLPFLAHNVEAAKGPKITHKVKSLSNKLMAEP